MVSQKDIVYLTLNPTRGHEQRGLRPAVVISGNAFHVSGLCIVCPLTSTIHSFVGDILLVPNHINNLKVASEVLVGHTRSVSIERISKKIGAIEDNELLAIFTGMDLVFDR